MTLGPSIDAEEVGVTGLLWLLLSYGYVLYYASNLISEGSELLLLIPSMAGLVGGVVLPLLGAVPDGAIILFSGLGPWEVAQETLSVGVGALAGSTIMLLSVPFSLSIWAGRVNIDPSTNMPNYHGKPKLTTHASFIQSLTNTGVTVTEAVQQGGIVMVCTTLPYFLIQVPAQFLHGKTETIAAGEHWWSLSGFIICLSGLIYYMQMQLKMSRNHEDKVKRMAILKRQLKKGAISLSGGIAAQIKMSELETQAASEYQSLNSTDEATYPPPVVEEYLKEVLLEPFRGYDDNGDGELDRNEVFVFFRDFHETLTEDEMNKLFDRYDVDKSGHIDLREFIGVAYMLIKLQDSKEHVQRNVQRDARGSLITETTANLAEQVFAENDEETEEVPEEFTSMSPEEQQIAIKKRAFGMLGLGTALVFFFSDPMVDVLQAIAIRTHIPSFYVSFILAPLAANASEVIASQYYAAKKTRKTITVSMTALEGAACMNNTFCLSIFMALIFFRGLAWHYTAETIAIVVTQIIMGCLVQSSVITGKGALCVAMLFPLSIAFVAILESMGYD